MLSLDCDLLWLPFFTYSWNHTQQIFTAKLKQLAVITTIKQLFDNHNEDNPGSNYVEIMNNPDNTLNDQLNLQETQDHNVEKNMDEYSKNEASDKGGHKWEQWRQKIFYNI